MFTRFMSSAPLGIAVTAALFYVMHVLIETGQNALIEPTRIGTLTFLPTVEQTELIVKEAVIEKIQQPAETPPIKSDPAHETEATMSVGVPVSAPGPTPGDPEITLHSGTGALMNIMKVSPEYPIRAKQKGLEGYVIVQYDVTAIGSTTNISVLASSHSVFERNSIRAAERFKYKARVIDGQAVATYGLRNQFTFNMEDELFRKSVRGGWFRRYLSSRRVLTIPPSAFSSDHRSGRIPATEPVLHFSCYGK